MLILTFFARPGAEYFGGAYFGPGNGFIFLDNVACNGNETSLISCSYTKPTSNDSHTDDAGVRCPGQQYFMFYAFQLYLFKMKLDHYQTDLQAFSCKNVPFSSKNFSTSILHLAFCKKRNQGVNSFGTTE